MRNTKIFSLPGLALLGCSMLAQGAVAAEAEDTAPQGNASAVPTKLDRDYGFAETARESMAGDVYAKPSKWQELSYSDLISKGWDKPWAGPPAGGGGAPRQGWLNAYDGVFFRLGTAIFGWQHDPGNSGESYTGTLENFTPINQRFQVQTDIPMASNQGGSRTDVRISSRSQDASPQTNFGDFEITPRFMLSETRDASQTINVAFRTPTGNSVNGNGVAAISPQYQFWANAWRGLVVRGGVGFQLPYAGKITQSGVRSAFDANLAVGYYFTPHEMAPIGNLVWYLSTNLSQTIDDRGPNKTVVTLTPGFRTHVGMNWFLLGAVEVPVTRPVPFDYQVLGAIMKVF